MIEIRKLRKEDFTADFLSEHFIKFYGTKPWNEYLKCTKCSPDFSSREMFSKEENINECPICNSNLELFWSPERTWKYFEEAYTRIGFLGFVALNEKGDIIGWIWGYELDPIKLLGVKLKKCFYIDVVCVIDGYRNTRPLVVGQLYINVLAEIEKKNYSHILTMTHLEAIKIRKMLKFVGFHEMDIVLNENLEMDFWIKDL